MRAIFLSDLHANLRLPFASLKDGGISSDRLEDVIHILDQVVDLALNGKEKARVFILGDLFDSKHPDGPTLVAVSRALRALAKEGLEVYILPGNHDAIDRDGRLYTLQFYGELHVPGIFVLGHERLEPVPGLVIYAVPWLPETRAAKRIAAIRGEMNRKDRNILLFHQAIAGAVTDSGWVSDDGLDPKGFKGFDLALSGHYHAPRREAGYTYLGAPLHLRFSDPPNDPRGVWVTDLEAKQLSISLHQTKYPMFGTDEVRLEEGDKVEDLVDLAESAGGLSYLRLVITGPSSAIASNKERLSSWKDKAADFGLRVLNLDLRPDRVTARARLTPGPVLSVKDLARQYAERFAPEGTDTKKLTRLGARLLEEAGEDTGGH